MTTLGSKLPKDDMNGLPAIAHSLLEDPHRRHLVIMAVDCGKIVEDIDEGTRIPMARINRIEAILPADLKQAERLLRNALSARHGSQELPLDDQRDLFSLFNPGVQWEENGDGEVVIAEAAEAASEAVTKPDTEPEAPPPVGPPDPASDDDYFDAEKAAREAEDLRVAANQAKRRGRRPSKIADPFTV